MRTKTRCCENAFASQEATTAPDAATATELYSKVDSRNKKLDRRLLEPGSEAFSASAAAAGPAIKIMRLWDKISGKNGMLRTQARVVIL